MPVDDIINLRREIGLDKLASPHWIERVPRSLREPYETALKLREACQRAEYCLLGWERFVAQDMICVRKYTLELSEWLSI